MIKNMIFDLGGVVVKINADEAKRRFRTLGIDADYYLDPYGQKGFCLECENGTIDAEEFCERLSQEIDRPVSYSEAEHCWLGFIEDVPVERLRDLEQLRKVYTVNLLSNTNPFVTEWMDRPSLSCDGKPLSAYFDHLFLSYRMKMYKPDAEIFLKALEIGGFKPEETIFIDDSLRNVEAARACGMHGLHVPSNTPWLPQLRAFLATH